MSFSAKTRVGVLRGGPSPEYEVSLRTGGTILANLPDDFEPLDVFISRDGIWHLHGLEKKPQDVLRSVDLVINATHGAYGEDGTLQKLLEDLGVPYSGSDSIASALGMNKAMAKSLFEKFGLKTPHHILIEKGEDGVTARMLSLINESLPFPLIVKPINSGSSLGVSLVAKAPDLKEALCEAFKHSPRLLVEEYIAGQEATCGVIEGFRGKDFYTLLPVEIEHKGAGAFYDYDSKYKNMESKFNIPGNFRDEDRAAMQEAAILAHRALGLRHYSRSDFILHPRRGLFVLEVNTLPELTHRSSFVKSLEAVGGNIREFIFHLLSKTLSK